MVVGPPSRLFICRWHQQNLLAGLVGGSILLTRTYKHTFIHLFRGSAFRPPVPLQQGRYSTKLAHPWLHRPSAMPLHIANLGSSFAAGPGIPPVVDKNAGRSGANYAHIVASRRGARLTDLTVSGATLLNVLDEPQVVSGATFAPQIDDLPVDADLVLILGGGNDVGYIGGLFEDSFAAYRIFRLLGWIASWFGSSPPAGEEPSLDADGLAQRYGQVLDAIHAKVPTAAVLVVEYQTVLGPDLKPGVDIPFDSKERLAHHRQVAETVRLATIQAVQARQPWCSRVLVAEPSAAHGIGAVEPWMSGWSFRLLYKMGAYHPNAAGMRALADLVDQKLDEMGITCLEDAS